MEAVLSYTLTFVLAAIPAIIWLVFFLREDTHPEPKRLIAIAFMTGAVASIPVLGLQILFQKFVASPLHNFLFLIFGLAVIEEVFKFFAARISVGNDPAFDEPVDAMIYMIAAALGFATIENLFIVGGEISSLSIASVLTAISTLGFRFIGATLLHSLASGLVGFAWAQGKIKKKVGWYVTIGLAAATVLHAAFNLLVYQFQDVNMLYPSLFLVFAALFILKDFDILKVEEAKHPHF
ncbi:PrsW family intramembrane metalloprotease [Patescibacteria group bacterium]|nr:PrsW family intramembrane metalloprotease [Patescibacteria group bacterium]